MRSAARLVARRGACPEDASNGKAPGDGAGCFPSARQRSPCSQSRRYLSLPFGAGAAGETGTWSAVLEVGALRLRLKLEIDADGKATLFSVDQGREPRPGRVRSGTPGNIEVEFPTIKAVLVNTAAGTVAAAVTNDGEMPRVAPVLGKVMLEAEAAAGPAATK